MARRIDMSQDPGCLIASSSPRMSEAFEVTANTVANILVYVKGVTTREAAPQAPAVIDQKGCRYEPHVIAVISGTHLEFTNSDPAIHNIHSQDFNESQMPKAPPVEKQVAQPEIMMPVECNQHPWMKMYVNVLPSPFFDVTKAGGAFMIHGLPPGEYTLAAVHERMGEKTLHINVAANTTTKADFVYNKTDVTASAAP